MSRTDEAIEKIRGLIAAGDIRPGERLPREADLAVKLGLSRSSLREAVRALSLVGVLAVRQGAGTYVGSLEANRLFDVMGFVTDLVEDHTVLEILAVRRVLEPAATAQAARRVTGKDLGELRRLLDDMQAAQTVEQLVAADAKFHDTIALASGNGVLAALLRGLSTPTLKARVWHGVVAEDANEETIAEHLAIYEALAAGDAPLAHAAALSHVAVTEAWLATTLGEVAAGGTSGRVRRGRHGTPTDSAVSAATRTEPVRAVP